ncbi:MAG: substrate-binding domain-containing protein [Pirellulales bacterium]
MKALPITMAVAIALAAGGCNTKPSVPTNGKQPTTKVDENSTNSKSGEKKKGTIGVSLMTLTNPFFEVIGDTITEEAAKRGYDTVVLSADEDAAKQSEQVKDFIVQEVAAIVLAPRDSKAIGPAIAQADAAGIPVFTVDNGCLAQDCKVVSHIATDNYQGGKQAGELMIEALEGNGGKVAVLDHKVTQSCLDRVSGFKEVLDAYNAEAENKIEIVAELPSGGNRQIGYASAKDILQSDPDVVGIFAINDPSALGAYAAIKEIKKQDKIRIIGFDGMPQGKEAIRDGKIYADPIQHPDQMGRLIVEYMMEYFQGKKVPAEKLIPTTPYRQQDGKEDKQLNAN